VQLDFLIAGLRDQDREWKACREGYDGVNMKPSSIQPVTPPIIIFTGKPSRARRNAALLAPLQCGALQATALPTSRSRPESTARFTQQLDTLWGGDHDEGKP
jgi:hypothetical protein